jgi:hypothetical protein
MNATKRPFADGGLARAEDRARAEELTLTSSVVRFTRSRTNTSPCPLTSPTTRLEALL